ncbi:TPA: hypothetical protein DEP34_00290 [Candidatus Uhrbacteria bacterium]|nr:hypothetical protein [Candidatus Uhrbacteria bacterium]HCB18812.1 hypothetical protein [Candidatus Uhrbacteria bacterium]
MKLLLHACCGGCGSWIPQELSKKWDVTLYFFNPNIHPKQEYEERLKNVQRAAKHLRLPLIVEDYDPKAWLSAVHGLEQEPEGGKRCTTCFNYRLEKTAHTAKTLGFDVFASTLTIGRNKKAEIINPLGGKIAKKFGIPFLARDFKKQEGTNFSVTCAEHFGIARQTYCGCVFSRKKTPCVL